jgi:hypothetical protein
MAWVMPGSDAGELSELLGRFDWLARQPVAEQNREFLAAQAAYTKDANQTNRLRLALALSLPQAPWRDDARVVALLADEMDTRSRPTLRRQASQLLFRLIMERQRLVKEEQRRVETAQQELKRLEGSVHDERRKAEDLQQKLDALREIDRNAIKPARR